MQGQRQPTLWCMTELSSVPRLERIHSVTNSLLWYAGAKAAHILVYDRAEQRVIEETISPYMVLGMRNMYQTPVGRMLRSGAHKALLELTQREGRYMNSPASAKVTALSHQKQQLCYPCAEKADILYVAANTLTTVLYDTTVVFHIVAWSLPECTDNASHSTSICQKPCFAVHVLSLFCC